MYSVSPEGSDWRCNAFQLEVSLGHAGIVLGLEVSRLARNNSDWHRLLEISALTGPLILDEDGLYDPSQFNQGLLFPRRLRSGLRKGELVWGTVGSSRVLQVLYNPRYAGAFFHGRTRSFRSQSGRGRSQRLPPLGFEVLAPMHRPSVLSLLISDLLRSLRQNKEIWKPLAY